MIVDCDSIAISPDIKPAEVCIVGSGPAGMSLALQLISAGKAVVLLESGRLEFDREIQALSDLADNDARRHAPMSRATRRQFGGTSALWGGRCVPLDAIDFKERPYVPHSGWPIGEDQMKPYWETAAEMLSIGHPQFDARSCFPTSKPIAEKFEDGAIIGTALERWSKPTRFRKHYLRQAEDAVDLTVYLGLTVLRIEFDHAGAEVIGLIAKNRMGTTFEIKAADFVLAAGGLETTRLLLGGSVKHPEGIGNGSGMLGRFYMGHLSGKIAEIEFFGDPEKTIFDFERDIGGVYCRRRITLSQETQEQSGIQNIAFWLDNPPLPNADHSNGILSLAYIALTAPILRNFLAPEAIRVSALAGRKVRGGWHHARNIVKDLHRIILFVPSFLARRYFVARSLPGFFLWNAKNRYALHYHAEHAPNANSFVSLAKAVDSQGTPRLKVNIRFSEEDAKSVWRAHAKVDEYLRNEGIGRLHFFPNMSEASVLEQATDGYHQIGTARMATVPKAGVVDTDLKVFGTSNLFCLSSAVFPTSGQANPTFTIVVLAIRLAFFLTGKAVAMG